MPLMVGSRRAVLGAPQRRVLAFDDFTDVDGTLLAAHVATDGGSWTRHPNSQAGDLTIDSNRLHNTNNANEHFAYYNVTPPSPDYDVEATFIVKSDNNASEVSLCGRLATNAYTTYLFRYRTIGSVWDCYSVITGSTFVQIGGNVTLDLVPDRPYKVRLSLRGSLIVCFVDGVDIISGVNTAVTAVGKPGFRIAGAATVSTGINVDDFRVTG